MRFVRYTRGGSVHDGLLTEDTVVPIAGTSLAPLTLEKLTNESYLQKARRQLVGREGLDRDDISLLAPVSSPGKIICVGLNYHDHAEESGDDIPESPLLFGKAPTTVTNPGDPIVHPDGIEEVDFEVELGVVIGREAKHVDKANATDYVAGYTAINDVSGRDAQFDDGQWFRGKSYDTFSPMGPAIAADGIDPNAVDVSLQVNGETMQSSNTSEFIFDVEELIEYISAVMTLEPGDVISTGTPAGVGVFREPPELLEPGDNVVTEIEGIGRIENPVVSAE